MTADTMLSRELKSLRDELVASQKEPQSPSSLNIESGGGASHRGRSADQAVEDNRLRETIDEFVKAIKEFVEEAGKSLSTNPAANVVGGIVVGILIGRLLGRR